MQPPGGGPPGDKRHPLPPPWGHPAASPTTTQPGHGPAPLPRPPEPGGAPPQAPHAPAQGYPPQHGYPPAAPQPGYPPQGPGYPPQGYPPQAPPHGYPPPGPPPHGYPPHAPYGAQPHPPTPLPLAPPPDLPPGYAPPYHAPAPGDGFVAFLKLSVRRAFRVRIEPSEVLPQERAALAALHPPIVDPSFQAFLAWRRSVLFLVACALVPLAILRAVELADLSSEDLPGGFVALQAIPLVTEILFMIVCWAQLKRWTQWQHQRRALTYGWLAFFLAPFVIFLYPMQALFEGLGGQQMLLVGMLVAMQATLTLMPKAISLMPGLMRAALVTKLLFPGMAAPGWLLVLAAPIYAVLVYVALVMPLQISGSGWFVLAMAGIIGAQVILARAGLKLARPKTREQAIAAVVQARSGYLLSLGLGGLFTVVAFASLIETMDLEALTVVNLVLSFTASVLALTLITTDLVIVALDQARGLSEGTDALADEAHRQIHAFVSAAGGASEAPPPVTPAGPGWPAPPGPPPA